MQACRDQLNELDLASGSHAGLLLASYLKVVADDKKGHPQARSNLLNAARSASLSCLEIYQQAFERWGKLRDGCEKKELRVRGRLIVGLGADNVLETGITLHHTYGVPIIPGSALKGMAAHYANRVWGAADAKWKKDGDYHKTVFGTQDDAGHIIFHDAWITPESLKNDGKSGLVIDVMTPHHRTYYGGKRYEKGPKAGQLIPPTDFDDPNPVSFLSVTGAFLVAVSCDDPSDEGRKCAGLAFQLLSEALRDWGIGGKTSSGYGRLMLIPSSRR